MTRTIVRNVRVFDGTNPQLLDGADVVIDGSKISAITTSVVAQEQPAGTIEVQGAGKVLIPGLTDAHVHLMASENTMADLLLGPLGAIYGNTIAAANNMLLRGFTTVRDMGGDMAGVKSLFDRGVLTGPRVLPSQALISQTAGHADFSNIYEVPVEFGGRQGRGEQIHFTRVANGVPHVLTAVREQLRLGASQIKVTLGGGVASLYDPLYTLQYTPAEIRAAVEAAADYGTYVASHVYTSSGVARALEAGVLSIEHGHLADEETIQRVGEAGAWLSMQPFAESDHRYPDEFRTVKNKEVCEGTAEVYGWAKKYGVKTAWGTDLLLEPEFNPRQSEMLVRMGDYYSNLEVLQMATSGNAELFELSGERNPYIDGKLGVIAEGAWADMVLVDGNPLEDLALLGDPTANFKMIMKDGQIIKNTL